MGRELAINYGSVQQSESSFATESPELQHSQDKYRQFYEAAPIGYLTLDADNTILDVNMSGARLLGTARKALLGGSLAAFVAPVSESTFHSFMKNVLQAEEWRECELEMVTNDGSRFYARVQGRRSTHAEERLIFVNDISKRKQADHALKESEKKYREVADLLAEGIFEADLTGTVTYANHRVLSSLDLNENDLKNGLKVFDVIAPSDIALAKERLGKVLRQEDIGVGEYLMMRKDGATFPALVHSLAIVREGKVVGVRGILIDISERKRAETALQESERKYRELAELLGAGIFEADTAGALTYSNPKGLTLFGLDENDLKNGFTVFDVILPQGLSVARENFARVLRQEDIGPVEYVVRRKDGTTFPGLTHSSAIVREDMVVGVRGVMVDISDLKRTEHALRESEERFRTLLKSLHEGIWALDKDDLTTFVNPRMVEMLGYTEEEMLGKPVFLFTDEEWMEFCTASLERRRQGVTEQLDVQLRKKDGQRVYALLEASPILDENGNYSGSIAGVQDITERKLAEAKLKQTMAELDRSNKELEQFAYVTSHDLREPLRMMTSFAQSLEKRYKDKLDNTANEYIHFIVDGAARMQRLIDDILIYSRVSTRGLPFEQVEMEKIFQEVLLNLKASLDETEAQITHDPLPVVHADPSQMKQVLQNLIGNALKFYREGSTPCVYLSARKEDKEWLFSVKDNGIGIDPELFGRLFNLFQRLHPPDKYPGTGVGLAVTKKIVQRHGGRIWVESQPEKGCTFHFSLPLTTQAEKDGRE
jgi:PAS domain S-box-containing protein